jgi:hypothetical protein
MALSQFSSCPFCLLHFAYFSGTQSLTQTGHFFFVFCAKFVSIHVNFISPIVHVFGALFCLNLDGANYSMFIHHNFPSSMDHLPSIHPLIPPKSPPPHSPSPSSILAGIRQEQGRKGLSENPIQKFNPMVIVDQLQTTLGRNGKASSP